MIIAFFHLEKIKCYLEKPKKLFSIGIRIVVLILVSTFSSVGQNDTDKIIFLKDSANILFVGNSLTYTNDLPLLIIKEGKKNGMDIHTTTLALPNYSLKDHWDDEKFQKLMNTNHYDFVVIQQGPSSQEDGRSSLLEFGAKFKKMCTKNGAELVFFMVWPSRLNFQTFDSVIKNYTEAANATGSILCDVGRKWKIYCLLTTDYSFYGSDMFHPSYRGSEFAAVTIYEQLFVKK